jgi:AcrR family transcriptional regulator
MSESASRGLGRRAVRVTAVAAPPLVRKISTKELLIDTAEQLFGQLGIDGVSLREIAAAAGQSNSNVVQYHFKDKSGLVSAILEDRVSQIDALRGEQLDALKASKKDTPRELLKIIWLPMMTIRNADGVHTFCRFLLQYLLQQHIARHPVGRFLGAASKQEAGKSVANIVKASRQLRAHYDHLPQATLYRRMSALSMMFLATVVEHDNARMSDKKATPAEFDVDPILDMAVGALSAPVS